MSGYRDTGHGMKDGYGLPVVGRHVLSLGPSGSRGIGEAVRTAITGLLAIGGDMNVSPQMEVSR